MAGGDAVQDRRGLMPACASSRHRSVCTTSASPTSAATAAVATFRMPRSSSAPEPSASRTAGTPNSITPPRPAAAASVAARRSESSECCTTPGIEPIGCGSAMPSRTNSGSTSCDGTNVVSRARRRTAGDWRRRRSRWVGKLTAGTRRLRAAAPGATPPRSARRRSGGGRRHRRRGPPCGHRSRCADRSRR